MVHEAELPGPRTVVPSFIDRFSESTSFYNNVQLGVTRLTRIGGGSFDLEAIDLDALNPASSGGPYDVSRAVMVSFVGTRLDLTTVSQSFTTDTLFPARQRFAFDALFTDLIKVEWIQGNNSLTRDAPHQFDNLAVNHRGIVDADDLVRGYDTIQAFVNGRSDQTIYTASAAEAPLWRTLPGMVDAGPVTAAPLGAAPGAVPVYRIYSAVYDLYAWTSLEAVKVQLLALEGIGIEDQGVVFNAYADGITGGTTPVHMLWDFGSVRPPVQIIYADEASLPQLDRPGDLVIDQGVQFWL